MKVLMLSWEYPPRVVGGIARVVHELSKKLVMQGHDVSVITYRDGNDVPYEEIEDGVKVYRVDNYLINPKDFLGWIMQLNFNLAAKAAELINEGEEFDVVHAHDWLTCYAAKTIKNSHKIPLTATIHATEAGRNSGIHNEDQRYVNDTEWLLTYEADQVIVNSNFMNKDTQRLFNMTQEKVKTIPNGIDLDKFEGFDRDYAFRRNYAADNEKIILTLGRIVQEKGIQHLIAAMPKIMKYYNDVKLVIGGKGPKMDDLKRLVKDLGIENKVYFAGFISGDDLQRMYKSADVSVFPSTYEPFGIVALEAMLAGIPTVVSDIGGLDEIVSHKVDGMKAYAGNLNSLADSILEVLHDKDLADKVVKNASRKVKELFNWDRISEMTADVYEESIKKFNEKLALEEKRKENELLGIKEDITTKILRKDEELPAESFKITADEYPQN